MSRGGHIAKVTTKEPSLQSIFLRQKAIRMPDWELEEKSGLGRARVARLRNPSSGQGKAVTLGELRRLGRAVGYDISLICIPAPQRPINQLGWIKAVKEVR